MTNNPKVFTQRRYIFKNKVEQNIVHRGNHSIFRD
jgi:hypothetical protein